MPGDWQPLLEGLGLDAETTAMTEALLDNMVEWLKNRPAVDQLADLARGDDEDA